MPGFLRRLRGVALALATALALGACASDSTGTIGPPTGETSSEAPPESAAPSGTTTPEDPTGGTGATGATGATGLIEAQNLCEVLDVGELSRVTGMRLGEGAFDGAQCVWMAQGDVGSLSMSLGKGENTARYIEELQDLDFGEPVDIAGAEDAAAVTITSGGSSRGNRVAVVAKVGNERLTVILTGRDANLDRVVELAELITNP